MFMHLWTTQLASDRDTPIFFTFKVYQQAGKKKICLAFAYERLSNELFSNLNHGKGSG